MTTASTNDTYLAGRIVCYHCGAAFTVEFADVIEDVVMFCPACGDDDISTGDALSERSESVSNRPLHWTKP